MQWLQGLDIELFRLINQTWASPVLDGFMPLVSSHLVEKMFALLLVPAGALLIWKGKLRGLICLLMLAIVLSIGDGFICKTLKELIGRDRPFAVLEGARLLIGKGGSGSMPSSHAANWFSAAMVFFIYYRRSPWIILPGALLVSFSRVYNGVHYPADVLVGAVLGAGYAVAIIWSLNALWIWIGTRWFPVWWQRFPSLVAPRFTRIDEELTEPEFMPKTKGMAPADFEAPHEKIDRQWVRLGYALIAVQLVFRLAYIAGDTIQLSEDEAYQWIWSKHPAMSYYSKPPLIAYTQMVGTFLWGDTSFGVRFFSPVMAALLCVAMLHFFAKEINARAGFFLLLVLSATPLMAAGSVLMTVDPLSVMFWTLAMLWGWRASRESGRTSDWAWTGLWMGLGFLSKYTELLQLVSWALFFILWPPARRHLRKAGPYLALGINLLCTLPVVMWNSQRNWITAKHLAENAGADRAWERTFVGEFLGAELGLMNPVFFVAMVWAAIAFWKRERRNPKLLYFFSMGAPVFLVYLLWSFRSRILPNWIAPSVVPLFCLMVIYWDTRWRISRGQDSRARYAVALAVGMVIGVAAVVFGYQTDLVQKVKGSYLPVHLDPLHRVREWDTTAQAVNTARKQLMAEGAPVFIITDHYGMAGQISFHLPEAREVIREVPLVYFRTSPVPLNQFYFWPSYTTQRKGQNAIFVIELSRKNPKPVAPPEVLKAEFESVTDLGVTNVMYHGYLLRPLQLFACRNVK